RHRLGRHRLRPAVVTGRRWGQTPWRNRPKRAHSRAMLSGFKKFATRGSLIDMASGIILGAAFTAIAKSLVDDIIMPPIGLALGGVDFRNLFVVLKQGAVPGPYPTLAAATEAGAVTIRYGQFLNF